MRTFVIGDIHGAHKALVQCLERSGFNSESDRLIVLGDVCDGYPQVSQCIEALLRLKHCILIVGNHDVWMIDWAVRGSKPDLWLAQGGASTMSSYAGAAVPAGHVEFLNLGHASFELDGDAFVHGGFDPRFPLKGQPIQKLAWDRDLLFEARRAHLAGQPQKFGHYNNIFVGHTPTTNFGSDVPLHFGNVWALDTGAGWSGKLTIMDVKTQEYWQSDPTPQLYGAGGRKGRKDPCD